MSRRGKPLETILHSIRGLNQRPKENFQNLQKACEKSFSNLRFLN